jgi:deoxyribodipyrimidine photolyase
MEIVKNDAEVTLPVEKLPHLRITLESIETLKELIKLLNKRKQIIQSNEEKVTEYEHNERAIQLIKTEIELAKAHTSIIQKEIHLKDFSGGMQNILNEMNEKWDSLMQKAESKAKNSPELQKVLALNDATKFDENWEFKVNFYVNVRTLVYPKIDPNKNLSVVK